MISLWRISKETINFLASFTFASGEISIGSTPPITIASRSELIISRVFIPVVVGKESLPQTVAMSTLADALSIGLLPGNKSGTAPAANAPTSPALRGIHPNFAPLVLINFATADKAPGVSTARSPTKTTDLSLRPVIELIAETSAPAAVLINFALNFSVPLLVNDAMLLTFIARFLNCL